MGGIGPLSARAAACARGHATGRRCRGVARRATADEQQREREALDLPFESDLAAAAKVDTSVPLLRPGEQQCDSMADVGMRSAPCVCGDCLMVHRGVAARHLCRC